MPFIFIYRSIKVIKSSVGHRMLRVKVKEKIRTYRWVVYNFVRTFKVIKQFMLMYSEYAARTSKEAFCYAKDAQGIKPSVVIIKRFTKK